MTPHPQQEYIITEKQLEELWIQCESRYFDDMVENIRSRPASSQPAAHQEIRGFVMLDRQRDFVLWLQQHDATIRNQTLDEFCKGFIRYIQEAQLDAWTDSEIINAINCCKKAEESLRTPSTQEQP